MSGKAAKPDCNAGSISKLHSSAFLPVAKADTLDLADSRMETEGMHAQVQAAAKDISTLVEHQPLSTEEKITSADIWP